MNCTEFTFPDTIPLTLCDCPSGRQVTPSPKVPAEQEQQNPAGKSVHWPWVWQRVLPPVEQLEAEEGLKPVEKRFFRFVDV